MNKTIARVLCLCIALGMLTGCTGTPANTASPSDAGTPTSAAPAETSTAPEQSTAPEAGAEGNLTAPGEFPIVNEKVTLHIVASDESYIGPLATNNFTTWYEDKTNVHIEFEEIAGAAVEEKVNLMLASNQLPDAFHSGMVSNANLSVYGAQGMFIPLNDLIEKQGVYSKKAFENYDDLPGGITSTDGNIYSLPNINECFHCMHSMRAWINTKWLENLNLQVPTTLDEFTEVLRAFKTKDPNGNGKADEYPMMGTSLTDGTSWAGSVIPFLLNSFIYYEQSNALYLDNGTVKYAGTQDATRDGLLYIRSLIDEGLIDPVSLTQTKEQIMTIGADPEIARIGVFPSGTWWNVTGADDYVSDNRSHEYDGLTALKGPTGVNYSVKTGTAYSINGFAITSKCENPDVAFRWADGLYEDEVTLRSAVGSEGISWNKPDAGALGINGKPALYNAVPQTDEDRNRVNDSIPNIMISNRTSDFRLGQQADDNPWAQETRLYNVTKEHFVDNAADDLWFPSVARTADETTEIALLTTQINDYRNEQFYLFLSNTRNIEKEWDAYVKEYENLKLDRYLELNQIAYDRQYK